MAQLNEFKKKLLEICDTKEQFIELSCLADQNLVDVIEDIREGLYLSLSKGIRTYKHDVMKCEEVWDEH